MIDETIARYDLKQDARHRDNIARQDRYADQFAEFKDEMNESLKEIQKSIIESTGMRRVIAWGITTLIAIIAVVVEFAKR